jgi:hypothetical protein
VTMQRVSKAFLIIRPGVLNKVFCHSTDGLERWAT